MNGQVPADVTFGKWLGDQPKGFRREWLGKGRFEKFEAGELEVRDLVDFRRDNRTVTLEELRSLDKLAD